MRVRAAWSMAACVIALGLRASAHAIDRPIDGQRLVLKQVGTIAKLTFLSRDPNFLFPPIGGPDDPATGSPGGATIELFSQNEGQATLDVPAGAGNPGWTVTTSPTPRYKFNNRPAPAGISPVRLTVLNQGRSLKVVAKDAGLPLAGSQGAVGIRITTGTLRSCARFAGTTIRKDVAGAFIASHATTDALFDCSDASMNGLPPACDVTPSPACGGTCTGDGVCTPTLSGCQCLSPSSPCGETGPACFGTCPMGEECFANGPGPFVGCVCLPAGSTPCGDPGPPVCGGACPSGTACEPVRGILALGGQLGCACAPPGPCGGGGAECPNGFACTPVPPTPTCVPISCFGTAEYPACGGTCVSGATCQPLQIGSFTTCLCAISAPCDAACGGYTCASGEVCEASTEPPFGCSCGLP